MNSDLTTTSQNDFHDAFIDLIVTASQLPPVIDHPRICAAIEKVCRTLGIARCEVEVSYERFAAYEDSMGSQNLKNLFFTCDEYDPELFFKHSISTPSNDALYIVYAFKGAPYWTNEELIVIKKFLAALFVINGRTSLMRNVQMLLSRDEQLDIFNSRFYMKNLNEIIAADELGNYAACRFNLKNFSSINSKIGKHHGTKVMKAFVHGLADTIGEGGIVSRLGGDNFICIFPKELFEDVKQYLAGTAVPTDFRGLPEVNISAYAGFLTDTEQCRSIDDVMERLAVAVNMAKFRMKVPCVVFNEKIKAESDNKKIVESLFFDAIEKEEFLVYYQPKVNIEDYTISGAEALCRWRHDGELIPPFRFIPALEQSNNICVLDFYMLEHVCMDIRRWLDNGWPAVKVSVNLSRVHLGDDKLNERIKDIINKYNIPHELIEIELTETTTDVDFTELKRVVGMLHTDGISTSVDDFGVGYSSLNLIRDLPWNVLKIDRSFLPATDDENRNAKKVMLMHVVAMAHQLGLECIVEGVETKEQVALLKECNCYRAQGFLFDRPLPVEDFEERIMGTYSYKKDDE